MATSIYCPERPGMTKTQRWERAAEVGAGSTTAEQGGGETRMCLPQRVQIRVMPGTLTTARTPVRKLPKAQRQVLILTDRGGALALEQLRLLPVQPRAS